MECCAEPGSGFVAWPGVIRGGRAGMIQFRRGVLDAVTLTQLQLSVNSPAGNDYGSPSLDCHYRMRARTHRLVRLHSDASAAAAPGANRGVAHAR